MSLIAPIFGLVFVTFLPSDLRARHRLGLEESETIRQLYIMVAFYLAC